MKLNRFIHEDWIRLLASNRRHPATDIASQRLHFLERDRIRFTIPRDLRERFQIELRIAGHDCEKDARLIAASDQCFENLRRRQANLLGDRLCG